MFSTHVSTQRQPVCQPRCQAILQPAADAHGALRAVGHQGRGPPGRRAARCLTPLSTGPRFTCRASRRRAERSDSSLCGSVDARQGCPPFRRRFAALTRAGRSRYQPISERRQRMASYRFARLSWCHGPDWRLATGPLQKPGTPVRPTATEVMAKTSVVAAVSRCPGARGTPFPCLCACCRDDSRIPRT
jgi:hypothetical protein